VLVALYRDLAAQSRHVGSDTSFYRPESVRVTFAFNKD
jgi:hypothetical protein